jgi:hypothetical protein
VEKKSDAITIGSTIESICEGWFARWNSVAVVTFDVQSKLSRIERDTFFGCPPTSITIPASVDVICENCFRLWANACHRLDHLVFNHANYFHQFYVNHRCAWPRLRLALLPTLRFRFCCLQRSCFLPTMLIPMPLESHFQIQISVRG